MLRGTQRGYPSLFGRGVQMAIIVLVLATGLGSLVGGMLGYFILGEQLGGFVALAGFFAGAIWAAQWRGKRMGQTNKPPS